MALAELIEKASDGTYRAARPLHLVCGGTGVAQQPRIVLHKARGRALLPAGSTGASLQRRYPVDQVIRHEQAHHPRDRLHLIRAQIVF